MANDFLQFAESGSANVYTQAEYVADTDKSNGNQPGVAKAKLVNKALRQCATISHVVAQFISDITGANSVDDGTTATLISNLKNATNTAYQTNLATAKTTLVDADLMPIADSAASFGLKKLSWANFKAFLDTRYAQTTSVINSLLAEVTVSGSTTASVTFSGLDLNAHKSYRLEFNCTNTAIANIIIQINGVATSASYNTKRNTFTTSLSITHTGSNTIAAIANTNYDSYGEVYISRNSISQFISARGNIYQNTSTGSNAEAANLFSSVLASAQTNGTSFTIALSAGYFTAGSNFRLYRGDV